MKMLSEQKRFEIVVDGRLYHVRHERSCQGNWEWGWTVYGALQTRWCDPAGRTHKRVVDAAEKAIAENQVDAPLTP